MLPSLSTSDGTHTPPVEVGVVVSGLKAGFGAVEVLHGVDLWVRPGEMLSLLGPSGCGKTTLLRCIAGLERPTAGSVEIGEATVSKLGGTSTRPGASVWVPPEKRGVGMVFQDGALFPHLDVSGNIAFGLSKPERKGPRVAEMLDLVGLGGLGDRMPTELSGGQQQRVALARALAPVPRVLLLDEPFSSLDVALRVSLRAEVRAVLDEVGVTALFVTHDQDEAFVMGDRVGVLRDGNLEQVATPIDLYTAPASPWIAAFVGDANLMRGVATGSVAATPIGEVGLVDAAWGDVQILLRPERLSLAAGGDHQTVASIEYHGHDTRYTVSHRDGSTLAVRQTGEPLHRVGDPVCVRHDGGAVQSWPGG